MKKLILAFACLLGSTAHATILGSDITKIKTTAPTGLIAAADSAKVSIDIKARTLKLDFYKADRWVTSFETRLDSVHEGVCDTMTYQGIATMDMGQFEIVVNDNKRFGDHCVSYFPVPPTSARLEVSTTFFDTVYTYRLEGTELKPLN